ncbi:hypothetical protein [Paraburkholderia kururiensis]|uniref:PEGA domain-containing protein n=1 Tax=Paraburkholderia kururiensis TaxID=984307 RepID=A0ABZ0WRM2_9BURK|nr:hypothetical protein [Paraburkholderia kururiensis]WQD80049.1 hypothetical protein U0042_10385 [Paraburkholderia kururiensis]
MPLRRMHFTQIARTGRGEAGIAALRLMTRAFHSFHTRLATVAAIATAATLTAITTIALTAALAGCAETPGTRLPLRPVPAERIVKPGYTTQAEGKVAVDVRREPATNVLVRLRDVLVYVDGERVTDLMQGEHVTFWLTPGLHRIAVSTQFDPVVELPFQVDARFTNRASVSFNADHRVGIRRVAQ